MKLKEFFLGLVLFVIGLLMTINPQKFFEAVIILLGAAAVVDGIYNLITSYSLSKNSLFRTTLLIQNFLSIIVGIIAVTFPFIFAASIDFVLKVLTYVLAGSLLLFAAGSVISATKVDDKSKKKRFTLEAVIYIAIAAVLFVISMEGIMKTLFLIVGIGAMLVGIILIVVQIISARRKSGAKVKVVVREENDSVINTREQAEDAEVKKITEADTDSE